MTTASPGGGVGVRMGRDDHGEAGGLREPGQGGSDSDGGARMWSYVLYSAEQGRGMTSSAE